jgi:alpha-ketoglutarate-dependent taurine dioxygenase
MIPGLAASGQVNVRTFDANRMLPLVIEASSPLDVHEWVEANLGLEDVLLRHGAVLLRNFEPLGPSGLHAFISTIADAPLAYQEQSSPRTMVQDGIYTSTEYPSDQSIAFHCENSYQQSWPLRIVFHCVQPAQSGGRTPLSDVRRVHDRIDAEIRLEFAARKVMYVRNFGGELGLPWQRVFQTDDKATAEAFCHQNGLTFEWRGDGLRTRAVRPAIRRHPRTGESVWFNHAMFFHVSTLPREIGETLRHLYGPDELPANTLYGDGTAISDEYIAHINRAYEAESVSFVWRERDVLIVDNMLVAHGRTPYTGDRKILVGMAQPTSG